jgi:amidophosphoribosyltransferase
MCGICALVLLNTQNDKASLELLGMLTGLRHRGYDSWGVASLGGPSGSVITRCLGTTFPSQDEICEMASEEIPVAMAIGHTRYTTQGSSTDSGQCQPMLDGSLGQRQLALVHNGQVETPSDWVGLSDTTWLLRVLRDALKWAEDAPHQPTIQEQLENALRHVHRTIAGAYACVVLIEDIGMLAFRDPRGIRPLVMGSSQKARAFASESCALDAVLPKGYDLTNVHPGQGVFIPFNQRNESHIISEQSIIPKQPEICLFEFIYLASDDSVIDGIPVRAARCMMGELMVDAVRERFQPDVIVPVPHTPVVAGSVLARKLGVEFCELLTVVSRKARKEGRTFILPTQSARERAVRCKFAINPERVEQCHGKRVLLVDDSIVRGTTLRHVVRLVREAVQPLSIRVASLSPPIISPNTYGIDIPDTSRLIAFDGVDTVASKLGADGDVIYQSLDVLEDGLRKLAPHSPQVNFEHSVFV